MTRGEALENADPASSRVSMRKSLMFKAQCSKFKAPLGPQGRLPEQECSKFNVQSSKFKVQSLYALQEPDDSVAVGLRKIEESLGGFVRIAFLGVRMPHDGLDFIAGTAVMQTVLSTSVNEGEPTPPKRCGTAP